MGAKGGERVGADMALVAQRELDPDRIPPEDQPESVLEARQIRGGENQDSAGPEHSPDLVQKSRGVDEMLDDLAREDRREGLALERQRTGGQVVQSRIDLACGYLRDKLLADVQSGDIPAPLLHDFRGDSAARGDVKEASALTLSVEHVECLSESRFPGFEPMPREKPAIELRKGRAHGAEI